MEKPDGVPTDDTPANFAPFPSIDIFAGGNEDTSERIGPLVEQRLQVAHIRVSALAVRASSMKLLIACPSDRAPYSSSSGAPESMLRHFGLENGAPVAIC